MLDTVDLSQVLSCVCFSQLRRTFCFIFRQMCIWQWKSSCASGPVPIGFPNGAPKDQENPKIAKANANRAFFVCQFFLSLNVSHSIAAQPLNTLEALVSILLLTSVPYGYSYIPTWETILSSGLVWILHDESSRIALNSMKCGQILVSWRLRNVQSLAWVDRRPKRAHTAVVLYDVLEWSYNPGQRVKMWSWQTSLCMQLFYTGNGSNQSQTLSTINCWEIDV